MESIDIFHMREYYTRQQIMLCLNGPISRGLLEEAGNTLRSYLSSDNLKPTSVMDVFSIYVEMVQNIRCYARLKCWSELDAVATVVVSRDDFGRYVILAGNLIDKTDGDALIQRVEYLAGLSKEDLKVFYKAQLRRPRNQCQIAGAGLGLIYMARKSTVPMQAVLNNLSDGKLFFSLRAVV